ncbi:MAG TPA: aminopeptidase P family protein [Bosea sp. (in: a-proteobacteria)]|jgi:Xaa-Pro aminopeptidase|uniref:aminopeptidase P family protein n=1 Tax=Bosea sp. (in: a-proteobacteria) TaxID=1871050 RepID=UPI002DDCA215|nr:aminopeptidase P family protein [Bosea sp. (in: a-proteobacteria)]HEV2554808.1 aminopeptidase P family protein [Bosea sp. (in: a-proteobacteria)]
MPESPALPTCRFQTFSEPTDPSQVGPRIAALRQELARQGLAGFIVPRADEHQGEYVPAHMARLAWLTGFTGSAGNAVILADRAALIVDGRYTIQSQEQTDTAIVTPTRMEETPLDRWIEQNLPAGRRLGYDPWLHTVDGVAKLEKAAAAAGGTLIALEQNPIDAIWSDRPAPPAAPVKAHRGDFAGEDAASKLARIQEALTKAKVDALVVSDPHALAWTFNIRGGDVEHTPLPLGYAIVPREGRPTVFLAPEKITNEAGDAIGAVGEIAPPAALTTQLAALGAAGARVRLDATTAASALASLIRDAGGTPDSGTDPIALMKARKNEAELAGARAAHLRDGAAMVRFLSWLAREAPKGGLTEIDAVAALEAERLKTGLLKDVSFTTIAGAGPNAALPHYRVTEASNRAIAPGILLVDSGGQYEDGTTDITRTMAIGEPSAEMRDRYTRVLKGHIAISRALFVKGTSGAQLDALARLPLWQAGFDFDHGTGHGVGSYLSVHEGPQRISKLGTTPLEPGMILSNEPGYYKEGHYGIRIENLIVVEERAIPGGERTIYGFETITWCPYERALIDRALLDASEIAWLDAYHREVWSKLADLVEGEAKAWLERACLPL